MGKEIEKVNPGRKRVRHTKAFKLEAVRLLELGQRSGAQLALELGIKRSQLFRWRRELQSKGEVAAFRGPGAKPLDERDEIARLKCELERVKEERDILKKAAAYFARELS
ncbi:MAG: transposase [Rhodocyclaceae bacterium]|jgi:transposase|nr:transposase [Rhodocyclaceae bacterium]